MRMIGVDVGGTFTDLMFTDTEAGTTVTHKVPTTPHDPSTGVLDGREQLCDRFGIARDTNAFIGPKVREYVNCLSGALERDGLRADLHIMGSNGGVATAAMVAERPVLTLLSGPAAGVLGGERFSEIIKRYGLDAVQAASDALMDYSERLMRRKIGELAVGTYSATTYIDGFENDTDEKVHELPIKVTLTVDGDELTVDLTGTADQLDKKPINMPFDGSYGGRSGLDGMDAVDTPYANTRNNSTSRPSMATRSSRSGPRAAATAIRTRVTRRACLMTCSTASSRPLPRAATTAS